ncbi:hypothetical protein [Planctomicrobium sp. SH527]|uniref:hypothetical protein n=1 Tax=Planctomicrobium sp. SH527 TaxID=3448123 RepID=UPI003F5C1049
MSPLSERMDTSSIGSLGRGVSHSWESTGAAGKREFRDDDSFNLGQSANGTALDEDDFESNFEINQENHQPASIPPVTLSRILSVTWTLYTRHLGVCLLVGLLDTVLMTLGVVAIITLSFFTSFLVQWRQEFAILSFLFLTSIGMVWLLSVMAAGNFRYFMAMARGKPLRMSELLRIDRQISRVAISGCLYWTMVCCGLLIGVIPGLTAMVLFWPVGRIVVDKNVSIFDSFIESYRISHRHMLISWALLFIHLGIFLATFSIPILGPFVGFSLISTLYSVTYLMLQGEVVNP